VSVVVRSLDADAYRAAIPALASLIQDAVEGGAGVNFLAGVTHDEAAAWWTERIPQVASGQVTPFVAVDDAASSDAGGAIVGSVLLMRSRNPNSPHRAEIGKVLVVRSARRQGIGAALMAAAEARAVADGRWLLILDTVSDSPADAFYRSLGWQAVGIIPNHAMTPDGVPAATTYFYKDLR
jgi:GNAT superfamily N-acetyltransferase